jgi:3-hydroxybutyrate dehydrogenase
VAIVTGAVGGLGAAICEELAARDAIVVSVDRAAGADLELDLATEDGNRAMVDATLEAHGRLDALVLNAGVQHVEPIATFPTAKWDLLMDVMCKGPFTAIQQAWPALTARPGGRVIVTASTSSFVAELYKSAYVAAKHAVVGLVKVAALEGAAHGLTVNAVAPGLMLTQLIENQLADQSRLRGLPREQVLERMLREGPAGRAVETAEVARLVAFLAGRESSGISGAVIPVDLASLAG